MSTAAIALACGVLGFLLVTQLRAGESLGTQLEGEREEDLATILANLSAESDRLQSEFTDLRLTLLAFEESAERDGLAMRNLERRLQDFSILAGVVAAEGEGIVLTVDDPRGALGPEHLVDTVQELRDAGAEAIDVNGVRLVVSSAFTVRNNRLLVDGTPVTSPYRVAAVGPAETMARALAIPNGVVDTLERAGDGVTATVDSRAQLTVPARGQPTSFVFGEPVTVEAAE
jgi:uncharacterized protein YlxW (UPF0749 family)